MKNFSSFGVLQDLFLQEKGLEMVQKSYGKMRGTRKKLKSRGKLAITKYLTSFTSGDFVHVNFTPSSPIQHPRFKGATGKIIRKDGRNYIIEIRDGGKMKKIYARPEHLKLQKGKKIE